MRTSTIFILATIAVNIFSQNCFDIGSAKQTVRKVQGIPKSINKYEALNKEVWTYDYSTITFKDNKVSEYNNTSNNLKLCGSYSNSTKQDELSTNTEGSDLVESKNLSFNPYMGKTIKRAVLRESPNTNSKITKHLKQGTSTYVFSNESIDGYYKVIDIASNEIGWILKTNIKLIKKIIVSSNSGFQSIGYSENEDPTVTIKNKSYCKIKLIIAGDLFILQPNTTKKVSIKTGNNYYVATAPLVIPLSGTHLFENHHDYECTFWIKSK